jgi:hypothetical protein
MNLPNLEAYGTVIRLAEGSEDQVGEAITPELARMFAAAPDMLRALKTADEFICFIASLGPVDRDPPQKLIGALEEIRGAANKATPPPIFLTVKN